MEVLARYASIEHQQRWLKPLLAGEIRSCFAMTEPAVASSDATNIESSIVRDGDSYVVNGHKWYATNATDPRCKIAIFMGKTDPGNPDRYKQQSMILVPMDSPGVQVVRALPVFGYYGVPDRASEVIFDNVRVPVSNLLLGEGRGFEIAQGRLGPGRIHHCMRWVGICERAFDLMCRRAVSRELSPGVPLASKQTIQNWIAESRAGINAARLMVLDAAQKMDAQGQNGVRVEISVIKFFCANVLQDVLDRAIQVHGALGITEDTLLSFWYRHERGARIYDGADEVHKSRVAKEILKGYGWKVR